MSGRVGGFNHPKKQQEQPSSDHRDAEPGQVRNPERDETDSDQCGGEMAIVHSILIVVMPLQRTKLVKRKERKHSHAFTRMLEKRLR